jgi:hypothetical protein
VVGPGSFRQKSFLVSPQPLTANGGVENEALTVRGGRAPAPKRTTYMARFAQDPRSGTTVTVTVPVDCNGENEETGFRRQRVHCERGVGAVCSCFRP